MPDEEEEDLGNPEHVQARTKRVKLSQREQDEELKWLLAQPAFRAWLWRFIAKLGPYRTPFGADPYLSYFAGGQQNVALDLLGELSSKFPDRLALMQKENANG